MNTGENRLETPLQSKNSLYFPLLTGIWPQRAGSHWTASTAIKSSLFNNLPRYIRTVCAFSAKSARNSAPKGTRENSPPSKIRAKEAGFSDLEYRSALWRERESSPLGRVTSWPPTAVRRRETGSPSASAKCAGHLACRSAARGVPMHESRWHLPPAIHDQVRSSDCGTNDRSPLLPPR